MRLLLENLSKTYPGGTKALDKVSLDIKAGMFGLLGPNGAGKSTLMRTIATLQSPDMGSISFNDIDVLRDKIALRKILGYLPQEFGVYPNMSAEKLLDYLAQLKGLSSRKIRKKRIDECLEITNLNAVRKKHVSGYSGGMKQRFGIAQLLLNSPNLIIVDEPTAGLDPEERKRFLNILREIGHDNIVIFSTHIVEDIRDLCTDMAILNDGKIITNQSPQSLRENLQGKIFTGKIEPRLFSQFKESFNILSSHYNTDQSIQIRLFSDQPLEGNFMDSEPTLEDVYFFYLK